MAPNQSAQGLVGLGRRREFKCDRGSPRSLPFWAAVGRSSACWRGFSEGLLGITLVPLKGCPTVLTCRVRHPEVTRPAPCSSTSPDSWSSAQSC